MRISCPFGCDWAETSLRARDSRSIVWMGQDFGDEDSAATAVTLAEDQFFRAGYATGQSYVLMPDRFGTMELATAAAERFTRQNCEPMEAIQ